MKKIHKVPSLNRTGKSGVHRSDNRAQGPDACGRGCHKREKPHHPMAQPHISRCRRNHSDSQ